MVSGVKTTPREERTAAPACRQAVEDFRRDHGVSDPLQEIDASDLFAARASALSGASV